MTLSTRLYPSVLISAFVVLAALAAPASADDTPAAPPDPAGLSMALPGSAKSLPSGSWIPATSFVVRFQAQVTTGALSPEVEVEAAGVPFRGQANYTGPSLTSSGAATVRVTGLANGTTYHWQARVVDASGLSSSWVPFASGGGGKFDVGVDLTPPSRPLITSATNPDQHRWYHNQLVSFHWTSRDTLSGVKGFSYVIGPRPGAVPAGAAAARSGITVATLGDGTWYLSVRSIDAAGNWSPTATFQVQIDRQAPRVTWLSPSGFTFNPYRGSTTVRFSVNKDVSLTVGLYKVGNRTPTRSYFFRHLQPGQVETITWTGRDARGRLVARGYYFFAVHAADHADNVAALDLGGMAVDPEPGYRTPAGVTIYPGDGKRIIVSLSRQTLYAYDGVHLDLQTYVTTGNPNLPTPPGTYQVMARYHPFEFISPWPPSSPYWYPPSWSTYAMLFRDGGYFLHDAPWRSVFGPGSNGPGQPGTNFGGTHGCVNIPPGPMLFLWNWTPTGTEVDVVP
ncbi:MAG: L,D-transpeptidase [Chloroflexi bacterium]|nr:L,D-transpeptidase [Chloroflexota bacterium]